MSAPEKAKLTLADLTPDQVGVRVFDIMYAGKISKPLGPTEQAIDMAAIHLAAIRALLADGGAK